MRRILELGTLLLLLTTLLTPISEMLDRWDPPGLANDTEMHLFALVLLLALVLLVARLLSVLSHRLLALTEHGRSPAAAAFLHGIAAAQLPILSVPPQFSPPLRI